MSEPYASFFLLGRHVSMPFWMVFDHADSSMAHMDGVYEKVQFRAVRRPTVVCLMGFRKEW